jgi:hypothetical protein
MADTLSKRVGVSGDYYGSGAGFDNYGSDQDSAYIEKMFSKKVLVQFYNESTATQLMNQDYEGEISSMGDSVVVRKDPTITVDDYTIGGTLTYQVPTEDAQTMYIDQAKSTAFRIDTIDDLQSDLGLPNRFQEAATKDMKETIDKELFDYMIAGSVGATDMSAALFDSNNIGGTAGAVSGDIDLGEALAYLALTSDAIHGYIVDLNTVLDEAKIKREGRWVVMNPAVAAYLKTSDLKQADVTGDPKGVIRSGLIGQVDGCDIYVTNHAFNFVDTDRIYTITSGTTEFCSFAAQITDTETLSIPDSFGKYYRSLNVYGRKVLQETAAAVAQVKK